MNNKTRPILIILSILVATLVFLFDISLPLGIAGGVPYVALVLLGVWSTNSRFVFILAIAASALTILGYFVSPSGGAFWVVLTNRGLALFAIWITAILLVYRKRAEMELLKGRDELEDRVKKRTQELQLSEQKFHDFADSGADRFWETDENYRYTFISNSTTNTRTVNATLGLTRWEMPGIEPNEELWRGFRSNLDARRPFRDFRYFLMEKDGKKTHLRVSGKPFFDDNGKFKGYRGTTVDESTEVVAKQKADEAHTKFLKAMESLSVGFVLWDADDRFVACNDYFRKSQGANAELLKEGTKFEDYIWERAKVNSKLETAEDVEIWVAERIADQRNPRGEHDVLIGEKWYRIRKEKLDDGSTVAYHTDITERKKIEEGFKKVFQSSPALVSISSVETSIILNVNEVWLKTLGYRKSEVIGKTPFELDILVDPEVRTQASQRIDQEHHTVAESQFRTKSGEIRDILVSGERIEFEDQDCYLFISQDITERKQAEEQLRLSESRLSTAQELVKLGYFEHDVLSRTSYWSDIVCKIFGVVPGTQMKFQNIMNFIHPDDRENLKATVDKFIETGGTYSTEFRIIRSDGETRNLVVTGLSVASDQNRVTKYVGALLDVTDEKRREAQLRQAQKMEAVGQLTSGISHDFNNILAELSINLSLISGKAEEDEYIRKKIDQAQQSIKSGARLTGQLLAFSREQNLTPEPTDIGTLVTDMNDLLGRSLGETITIEPHTQPDLWPAMIDRHQLENAILNLAINARDAMLSGGTLTIDCLNEHIDHDSNKLWGDISPGDYTVVVVADTGTGIPEDVLNNVFDPFFTTKKVGHGTGLGLSMVDGFIRQSNGYLNIESEEGVGTSISLYLPRAKELPATKPKKSKIQKTREGHGETILLVEDNVNLRKLAAEMLDRLNYKVIDGDDGSEAQKLFNGHDGKIDLLLSDVILPHGNTGPKIARKLREQNADLKVLLMSGYADLTHINGGEVGVQFPLIDKPFKIEDIASAIHDVLQVDIK